MGAKPVPSEPNSPGTSAPSTIRQALDLSGRVVAITGAAGLLGQRHAEAVAELGANLAVIDLDADAAAKTAADIIKRFSVDAEPIAADITDHASVSLMRTQILDRFGRIDVLINNAARNPKVEDGGANFSRMEIFPLSEWQSDIAVGLTGAFLCARALGPDMAMAGRGAIINIASDLGIIAPDQRLYRRDGAEEDAHPVKPVSYSVVKHGLIGLTRYIATYWADRGVRCNALAPGGIYAGQDAKFLSRLEPLIPLGRMAHRDELKSAIGFLASDASSYMNGAVLVMDGGRSVW